MPKGNYDRIQRDLKQIGFEDVEEINHGQSVKLADNFIITSYQFGIFLDSAVVIDCDGIKILNLNILDM